MLSIWPHPTFCLKGTCRLCGIALKSRELIHNPLVTIIGSSVIWPSDLAFLTQHDPFPSLSGTSSRQTLWPIFKSTDWKYGLKSIHKTFLRFDLVTSSFHPFSNLHEMSARQTFWPSFESTGLKMLPLCHTQGFSKIWPAVLVFDSNMIHF